MLLSNNLETIILDENYWSLNTINLLSNLLKWYMLSIYISNICNTYLDWRNSKPKFNSYTPSICKLLIIASPSIYSAIKYPYV